MGAWIDTFHQMSLSAPVLVLLVLLIALAESLALVGLLVPGVVLITAAASLAGHQDIALPWLLGAAFVGAIIGDGVSFQLGYRYREQVTTRWPLSKHPEWLTQGIRFFQRYGAYSVFIGRFVGPVRPIIPLVAGMMRMPRQHFLWANVISALLWAPAYVLPGYLLGHTWQQHLDIPPNIENALLFIGAAIVVLALLFSWARHQVGRHGRLYRLLAGVVRRFPFLRRSWLTLGQSGEVPLASLLLLVISLAALSGWTLYVINQPGPLDIDLQAQRLFAWIDNARVDAAAGLMAKIGDKLGITALFLPWGVWMLWRRQLRLLAHWASALLSIALLNTWGKAAFGRPRPDTPDYLTGSLSYPSAHTSTSVVLFGLAAAFAASALPRERRGWIYWAALAVVFPMALSRLVIGVHWLSDLIGGALLGLVVCALVRLNWQRQSRRIAPCPWRLLTLASLVLLSARIVWLPYV